MKTINNDDLYAITVVAVGSADDISLLPITVLL